MADLRRYFSEDDGSLPEVEVRFADAGRMCDAFESLFAWGGRNVAIGGGSLWLAPDAAEPALDGAASASLAGEGEAEGFHVVLADIDCGGVIPDLGVLVHGCGLTFDYRMGRGWNDSAIASFVELLRRLRTLGGELAVPWWGEDGEREFRAALDDGQRIH